MTENKNFFKEALEKYYKPSFIRRKEATEPNFVDKVNDCIASVLKKDDIELIESRDAKPVRLGKKNKELIILPNGCYTKMLESDDSNTYTKCLSQFGDLSKGQIFEIRNCIMGENVKQ